MLFIGQLLWLEGFSLPGWAALVMGFPIASGLHPHGWNRVFVAAGFLVVGFL